MRKLFAPAALPLLCACAGLTLPDEPVLPEHTFKQRDFPLGSGLRMLVQEDHSAPLVAVVAVYGVGSGGDPGGQEGLAHLVEHLTFRARAGDQTVAARLRHIGASYNAGTATDTTTYHALARREHLEELLELERHRLSQPLAGVTTEVLAVEREVVRNERRQRGVDPGVFLELVKQAFPAGHGLARHFAANAGPMDAFTLEAAQQLVARSYQPDNCTIVVAGDVRPDEVASILGRWPPALLFGPQGPGGPPRPHRVMTTADAPALARPSTAIIRRTGPVSGRRLLVAWAAPPDRRIGEPLLLAALGALRLQMTDYPWSRLAGALEPSLFRSRDGSLLAVELPLSNEQNAEEARDRLFASLPRAQALSGSRRLLGRYKWLAGTELLRQSSDLAASARALAQYVAFTGRSSYYRDTLEQLAAIQPQEVAAFVEGHIRADRAVSVLVEPSQPGKADDGESGTRAMVPEPVAHELDDSGINLARLGSQAILTVAPSPGVGSLPRFRLDNGLDVVAVLRKRAPVTRISVRLARGDVDMSPFGLASLSNDLSKPDCHDQDYLMAVGGTLRYVDWERSWRYQVQMLSGNLENGLLALSNQLRCRELVSGVVERKNRLLARRESALKTRASQSAYRANHAYWAALYPNQAYGLAWRDTAALARLGKGDLQAALQAQYAPAGSLAVIVTDQPEAEVRKHFARYLDRWDGRAADPVPPPTPAPPPPARRMLRLFESPGRDQARVRVGCRLPAPSADTWPAYQLLEAILGHEAEQVRASWGASYGLDVDLKVRPGGLAHLTIDGAVDSARAGDTLARLLASLERLGREGPDIKTFTVRRWDLARMFATTFATGEDTADAILEAADMGFPIDVWDRYPAKLAGLQRVAIRDLLQSCPGREAITLQGNVADLTRQLAAHGLAPTP
jgi:zinc protease